MQAAIEDILRNNKVDGVFSGHVHAYERSCQVYQYKCTPGAPYYITIGDGGNKEGLASGWVDPQPEWSLYRQASYGFGELRAINSTHVFWSWHQNGDLVPEIADSFYFVKDSSDGGGSDVHHVDHVSDKSGSGSGSKGTGEAVFVGGDRGAKAEAFNSAAWKETARMAA
jgi:hypothetical protein